MEGIPLVSVFCPTYNHEKYIRQCLEGFVMQKTTFSIEIIVQDDASTDNTSNIINEFREKYHFIIPVIHVENIYSQGKNLNEYFFKNAKGKYIALCEGDDYWTDPLKLQKQVDFLEKNEDYGLVWTDVDFYYQSSGKFKKGIFKNKILPIYNSFDDILINRAYIAPCTWLFRRKYILKEGNDYCDGSFPMVLDILAKTKIKYLDEVTAVYRYSNESISHYSTSINRYKRIKEVYKIQKDYLKKYNLSGKIEEAIDLKHFETVFPHAVIFDDKKAIEKGKAILNKSLSKSMKIRVSLFLSKFSLGIFVLKFIYTLRDKFSK